MVPCRRFVVWIACYAPFLAAVDSPADEPLSFRVKLDVVQQELNPDFCWFHPRVAAIPAAGQGGKPAIVLTLQKHLRVSDHYSGMYYMRSDNGGKTWTQPVLPPQLDWRKDGDETIAVCDATPGWHAPSGKLILIGTKLRYSQAGDELVDKPRSHECAYAIYDPKTDQWSGWKLLEMPDTESKFFLVAPGCVQWLVEPDGSLLVPMYFRRASGGRYTTTVLKCSFDGETLKFLKNGDELGLDDGRGLYEPSLTSYRGRYYLTLRNDGRAYVATSDDGLKYSPIKPWSFDDGQDLGSYNTQAHWLAHSDGLFLAYTRRGANNDHIMRHRAPLFLAQVDPETLRVLRKTEQVLIPERGVPLGNFGAAAIDANESWVTDAEYILSDQPHPGGANGSVFASRVIWSRPNQQISVGTRPARNN